MSVAASWLSELTSKINATSPLPRMVEPEMPRRLRNIRLSGLITVWCWPSRASTITPYWRPSALITTTDTRGGGVESSA